LDFNSFAYNKHNEVVAVCTYACNLYVSDSSVTPNSSREFLHVGCS